MDLLLGQIKVRYAQKRLQYLSQIAQMVHLSDKEAQRTLGHLFQSHELTPSTSSKDFREINNSAIAVCKSFMQVHLPPNMPPRNQLEDFIGPVVLSCFDLDELLKLFSCLLLEHQLLFVSERRDLISKVMFTLRDLILQRTEFQWHCFFITCLPSILIDNLNAPFPTMIGIMRDLFDNSVDELCDLYLDAKDTPFQMASPCIVDIDQGKIMEIEEY